jgi:quercetin dioxygenase-like cupin family protein
MDRPLQLTPHETVAIREQTPAALVVEGRWEPGGAPPPGHFHPGQDERFEVLEGRLCFRVDGSRRTLGPGEAIEIPRGTVHQVWNEGEETARAMWRSEPAGRTADWFKDLHDLRESGRVGRNGMPGPLAFGAYLTEYSDVFRLAGPQALVRATLRALGTLGRLKGYRPAGSA